MKLYGGIDLHSNNSVPALLDDEGIKAKIIRHDDQLGQWNYVMSHLRCGVFRGRVERRPRDRGLCMTR